MILNYLTLPFSKFNFGKTIQRFVDALTFVNCTCLSSCNEGDKSANSYVL
jgi:hypothetical protein